MQENETGDVPWWRETSGAAVTVEHVATPKAVIYYVQVHDSMGQKHRFLPAGVYWSRRDMRVQLAISPAVGTWELVPAPGEPVVDWDDLGKLLDDGRPPADNGETIA